MEYTEPFLSIKPEHQLTHTQTLYIELEHSAGSRRNRHLTGCAVVTVRRWGWLSCCQAQALLESTALAWGHHQQGRDLGLAESESLEYSRWGTPSRSAWAGWLGFASSTDDLWAPQGRGRKKGCVSFHWPQHHPHPHPHPHPYHHLHHNNNIGGWCQTT